MPIEKKNLKGNTKDVKKPALAKRKAGAKFTIRAGAKVSSMKSAPAFDTEQILNIGSQSSGAGAGKITFNPF